MTWSSLDTCRHALLTLHQRAGSLAQGMPHLVDGKTHAKHVHGMSCATGQQCAHLRCRCAGSGCGSLAGGALRRGGAGSCGVRCAGGGCLRGLGAAGQVLAQVGRHLEGGDAAPAGGQRLSKGPAAWGDHCTSPCAQAPAGAMRAGTVSPALARALCTARPWPAARGWGALVVADQEQRQARVEGQARELRLLHGGLLADGLAGAGRQVIGHHAAVLSGRCEQGGRVGSPGNIAHRGAQVE